ncbi:MAG: nicotinate (nicotinamide) nucleotide adenylyltransferase [Clostridia bacterium]|nr:nicotinate (nicotinamide) nucleotide adenylyltransferase [Clostridia bacterium]
MDKKQIVVFGGCFNPPLNSHFSLAEQLASEHKQIEKIVFVPVNEKYNKDNLIKNEHRYNMLKLVCDKNEKFDVSKIEMDSIRPLYTIETLEIFKEMYPKHEIAFTIGSDNLKELHTWKESDKLMKDFKIYVLKRDKDNIENIINGNNKLKENKDTFIETRNNITTSLSSSYIRERIKNNKSIRYLLPEEIINYIEKNKLYY